MKKAYLEQRLRVVEAELREARASIAALVPEMDFSAPEVNAKLAMIDRALDPKTVTLPRRRRR